jgi:hypothetical protein
MRTPSPARRLLLLLALLGPWASLRVSAQEVTLEGAGDVAIDRRLARLLEAEPLLVTEDLSIARGDTVRRSVLVLDATLVHEGVILGDLVIVDGGAFVRPRSVVMGDLVNAGGGLYRSEIAVIRGRILDLPNAAYAVIREPDRIVIRAGAAPSPLVLDGAAGLHLPTYDRVNGVTLGWGATYHLPDVGRFQPRLHGQVGWHTQRGDPGYAADFAIQRSATTLAVGHERGWATRERWARSDLVNSLLFLWDGQDMRDYHEVERSWAEIRQDFADQPRRFQGSIAVRARAEDASSLPAGSPWFLRGSDTRENATVDDGRITSVLGTATLAWEGAETRFNGSVELETARIWRGGEARFDLLRTEGGWAMAAFADHTLTIDYLLQVPLAGEPLPRQRWSFVGGPATLATLATAETAGDRVVFVETGYIIPLPEGIRLPLLGSARLHLVHVAGRAWTAGEERTFHQEAGLRLDVPGLFVRFVVVPDDPRTNAVTVGVARVFGRRYPWEG